MNLRPFTFIVAAVLFLLLHTSYAYVREQKLLIKPVYFQKSQTALHASAGFRTQTEETVDPSTYSNSGTREYRDDDKWRNSGLYRIPRRFIVGARLRSLDSALVDGIRTKRNTWEFSTPYEHSQFEHVSSHHQLGDPNQNKDRTALKPEDTAKHNYNSVGNSEEHSTEFDGETWVDDENTDEFADDEVDEPLSAAPDARIVQQYMPGQNYSAFWRPFEIEGYKPYKGEKTTELVNPIHRSPSPWPERDTTRLGTPKQIACTLPLDLGTGPDEISSWYYSPQERRCRWFGYRGHGGNANRFYSRAACEAYCIRDMENMCEAVTCSWTGTTCSLMEDWTCKDTERSHGRDWRLKCPPDHPVCLSRRKTRMSPDISFGLVPPECYLPNNSGSCERKNPSVSYYYDRGRNACMTLYFHNCGGNDNRFNTKSDCMTHCSP